jgi:hypothetical protein
LIENCELTQYDDTISQDNSIYYVVGVKITGGSCTVKRMNVHDVNDCIYITGGGSHQILGNYLHDLGFRTDDLDQPSNHQSHNDLIQMRMGSNNVVDGNNFEGIYSTLTGMNSTINPVPLPTEQVWPNCHCIIMEPALGVISNAVIQRNWFKYGACGIHFTSNTYSGNTATFQNNRFTPDQSKEFNEYTQIRIDPTTIWGVTDGGGNVYSNDSDTPSGDRGTPLKAPTTFSTTKVWQYNKTVHTP